jgi:hypothetical protein
MTIQIRTVTRTDVNHSLPAHKTDGHGLHGDAFLPGLAIRAAAVFMGKYRLFGRLTKR